LDDGGQPAGQGGKGWSGTVEMVGSAALPGRDLVVLQTEVVGPDRDHDDVGPGDIVAFAIVCAASGLALGADLALPPSILADVIGRLGPLLGAGAYFGGWTLATKLNLALAAGIALPLLGGFGYVPGTRDAEALQALALVYAGVPCLLKLLALGALVAYARFTDKP
jgi:Na+/melibiose symporter-like transporter